VDPTVFPVLVIACLIPFGIWVFIALAGAVPVFTLHRTKLEPLGTSAARTVLQQVFSSSPIFDHDELNAAGFAPLGVFQASGLMGNPKIVAFQRGNEATWLCGYLLPTGQVHADMVSVCSESVLSTGTSKDGQFFPSSRGNYVQTFDIKDFTTFLNHHDAALTWLERTHGLKVSSNVDFIQSFTDTLVGHSRTIRSIPFWIARIPWWYIVRRSSRHNRSVEQLEALI
jgi:hypothetical protein